MALTLLRYESLRAAVINGGPNDFPTPWIDLGGQHNVLIMCYLNQVNSPGGYGGFGAAQIFITEYVQSGKTHSGSWQFLQLDNVSKVKFTLTVQNADVQAIGCVFAT
jgi:hypothetical protein